MSARCYVCLLPIDDVPGAQLCEHCLPAKDHIISMRTDGMVCRCGWVSDIGYRLRLAQDEACRSHWNDVIGDQS